MGPSHPSVRPCVCSYVRSHKARNPPGSNFEGPSMILGFRSFNLSPHYLVTSTTDSVGKALTGLILAFPFLFFVCHTLFFVKVFTKKHGHINPPLHTTICSATKGIAEKRELCLFLWSPRFVMLLTIVYF